MSTAKSFVVHFTTYLLLFSEPLLAQEPLKGIGSATCHTGLELQGIEGLRPALASWVLGFYSALNFTTMNRDYTMRDLSGSNLDPDQLADWILGRCLAEPNKPIIGVALEVFEQLPFVDVSSNR